MKIPSVFNALKITAVLTLLALVTGCGEPTIDGSSEAAMKNSVEEIKASLPTDAARESFSQDLKAIGMYLALQVQSEQKKEGSNWAEKSAEEKSEIMISKVSDTLSGMNAQEVSQFAEQARPKAKALLGDMMSNAFSEAFGAQK